MMMGFGGGELDEIEQHFRLSSSALNMMVVAREENLGMNVNIINSIEYGAMVELPDLQAQPNLLFDDGGSNNWVWNNDQPYNWSNGNIMMGFGGGGSEEIMQHFRSLSSTSNTMVVAGEENSGTNNLQAIPNLMFDDAGSSNWLWNNYQSYNSSYGNMMTGIGDDGFDEIMQHFIIEQQESLYPFN